MNPTLCTSVPNLSSIEFSWGGAGTDIDVYSNLVLASNIPPTHDSSLPDFTWPEETSRTFNISGNFSDVNGDGLRFTNSAVENISIHIDNSTGIVNMTPQENFFGVRSVVFYADDGDNLTASNNVTLNVTNVNDLPSLDSVLLGSSDDGNRTNGTLSVSWQFSDPDNDDQAGNETFWYVNGTEQADLRNLTSIPSSETNKTQNWTVSVRVSDGTSFTEFLNASLLIKDSLPRFLHGFTDQQAERNRQFSYDVNATDLDGDSITFSDNSSLFAISSAGLIQFTPADQGNFTFNITLTQADVQDSGVFTLQVTDTLAPEVQSISTSNSGNDPVDVTLLVDTDEIAECRFSRQNLNFTNMTGMSSTNATSHSNTETFVNDTTGTYFVRCEDLFGNTMQSSANTSFNAVMTEASSDDTASGGSSGGGGSGGYECRLVWDCTAWTACEEGQQERTCKLRQVDPFTSLDRCPQHTIPSQERFCSVPVEATCTDGVQNQDETGVDCGGSCEACQEEPEEESALTAEEPGQGNQITGAVIGTGMQATYWGVLVAFLVLLVGVNAYLRLYPKDVPQADIHRILQENGLEPDDELYGYGIEREWKEEK